jgi:hypothetical protein
MAEPHSVELALVAARCRRRAFVVPPLARSLDPSKPRHYRQIVPISADYGPADEQS